MKAGETKHSVTDEQTQLNTASTEERDYLCAYESTASPT